MQAYLYLVILLPVVLAYPTGAPDGSCATRVPSQYSGHYVSNGKRYTPQVPNSPNNTYKLTSYMSVVEAFQTVDISLSTGGSEFKGILLFALDEQNSPQGEFSVPIHQATDFKVTCDKKAVTHSNGDIKYNMHVVWHPPHNFTGSVTFKATLVKSIHVWWEEGIQSDSVQVLSRSVTTASASVFKSGLTTVFASIILTVAVLFRGH